VGEERVRGGRGRHVGADLAPGARALDEVGDELAVLARERAEPLGLVGPEEELAQDRGGELRVALVEVEEAPEEAHQRVHERRLGARSFARLGEDATRLVLEDREEKRTLVARIEEERPGGDAGARRDRAQRRRLEPPLRELGARRALDARPLLALVALAPAGGRRGAGRDCGSVAGTAEI